MDYWDIPLSDLAAGNMPLLGQYREALDRVVASGQLILGEEVRLFEQEFANFVGVKHAVGVGNGTDALVLSLMVCGIGVGDEVITVANSFLASASCIALCGATPVFADIGEDLNICPQSLEKKITDRTKAVIAVHLTGRPARMAELSEIARRNGVQMIEDASQAAGASINGVRTGAFGDIAAFSLHPSKTLAALGDGGVITTNDAAAAKFLRVARNHGLDEGRCLFWSHNSRLDELQASFLRIKLRYLDENNQKRRDIAQYYTERLSPYVECAKPDPSLLCAYHLYLIQTDKRDELKDYLADFGVQAMVHYPVLTTEHSAAAGTLAEGLPNSKMAASRILSLPVHESLSKEEVQKIAQKVIDFF